MTGRLGWGLIWMCREQMIRLTSFQAHKAMQRTIQTKGNQNYQLIQLAGNDMAIFCRQHQEYSCFIQHHAHTWHLFFADTSTLTRPPTTLLQPSTMEKYWWKPSQKLIWDSVL